MKLIFKEETREIFITEAGISIGRGCENDV